MSIKPHSNGKRKGGRRPVEFVRDPDSEQPIDGLRHHKPTGRYYRIENGKVGAPVKGAMLIGNGPTDLHRISMIGNDFALDPGIGTCGKNGQGVPVGVGQPSLRMDKITVGGTA